LDAEVDPPQDVDAGFLGGGIFCGCRCAGAVGEAFVDIFEQDLGHDGLLGAGGVCFDCALFRGGTNRPREGAPTARVENKSGFHPESEVLRNPVSSKLPGFWHVLHPTENRYKVEK